MHFPTLPAHIGKRCRQCQYFNPCRRNRTIGDCYFFASPVYAEDRACTNFVQFLGTQKNDDIQ